MGETIPDHEAGPIELMCDELFAYAVLYDQFGGAIHTAIASGQTDSDGGGPLVYSLSHSPAPYPGLWSVTEIAGTFTSGSRVTHAKAFTPRLPA